MRFPSGVWPVMLTPFDKDGALDYPGLKALVDWYIAEGSAGLFAVCQSSEMFFLSLEERAELTRAIKEYAKSRVPVISSGHVSYAMKEQIRELQAVADAGADALILLSNRLAAADEPDEVLLSNLKEIMQELPEDVPLGFYECPYPYKRVLSPKVVEFCADSGRFYFLKDTCCDIEGIRTKLSIMKGSPMQLYNANTSTLLESLEAGAAGYSGVMANFHPALYVWLLENWQKEPEKAAVLQGLLTTCSFIELKNYPLSAKEYLKEMGLPIVTKTRKNTADHISATEISELAQIRLLSEEAQKLVNR